MPEVMVEIAGRSYRMGCGEGEEDHIKGLAMKLDTEAQKLQRGGAVVPETRLLLMTALVMADRLWEAQREIRSLEQQIEAGPAPMPASAGPGEEEALAVEIEALAARVEALGIGR